MAAVAAVTDAYATVAEYKAAAGKTITAADDIVTRNLVSISRWIDRRMGRHFTVDAADVTRVFRPGQYNPEPPAGWVRLWIPDLSAAPTSVTIDTDGDGSFDDETALVAGTDYELMPWDALQGSEANPYEYIDLTEYGDQVTFPHRRRVQVVGKWGWPAVPSAITDATIEIARILRIEGPRATQQIAQGFESVVGASPQAMSIVYGLAKIYTRTTYS